MPRGVVKWFSPERGFGFISPDDGAEDVFVRFSGIAGSGFRTLAKGEEVSFEIADDDEGKPEAMNVREANRH